MTDVITFPVFTGKITRADVGFLGGMHFAETVFDGITFYANLMRDADMSNKPDENQDGFWPSLNPKDDGFIGFDKTPEDLREMTAKAEKVMAAFKAGRAFYVGVRVVAYKGSFQLTGDYANSLWGIECNYPGADHAYLSEVASELAHEALPEARAKLAKMIAELQGN